MNQAKNNAGSGRLVLLVGPSGSGKGTVLALLREWHPEWVFPVSATTRAPRPGERDGQTYFFLSEEEFLAREKAGDFLETAVVHGGARYGTLASQIVPQVQKGKIVVREVDIAGFHSLKKHFSPPVLRSIFLLPPPKAVLVRRLRERSPIGEEELARRMASLQRELPVASECDVQIEPQEGNPAAVARAAERAAACGMLC